MGRQMLQKIVAVLVGMIASSYPAASADAPLVLSKTIPLTGYDGGFDHFAFDSAHGRFFLAAEDHGTVDVFDLKSGAHLKTLRGFNNPHNIVIRSGAPTMLVADSGPSKSQLLDATSYRNLKSLPLEIGANATLYDSGRNRIYITTGGDRVQSKVSTLISVDPDTGDVLKSAPLPSIHLQPLAMDAATNRLFVNLADKGTLAVLDRDSFKLLALWPVGAAKRNSAIIFDAAMHRLYVMGKVGFMTTLNSDTGEITDTISVPQGGDDLAFDNAAHRLYMPGGSGFIGVYDVTEPDRIKEASRVTTRMGASTGLLIPSEHKYLLAAPATKETSAAVLIFDVR